MTLSSFNLLHRCLVLLARCVLDGLLLNGRWDRMPMGTLLESHRLAPPLYHRADAPFEASRRIRTRAAAEASSSCTAASTAY